MIYKDSIWDLLRYKIRVLGLRDTAYVSYLHLQDAVLGRIGQRYPGMYISPRSIQIEVTTRCNLKCTHCELSYWTEVGADLRLPEAQKILDHLPRLRRVELTGIGEPLMNRDFYRIVEHIKSRGIRISMVDNFTMMTEKASRRVLDLGVDRICISLDGATKETFEKVRVGANFDKVVKHARRFVEMKRERGLRKPEFMANFVVTANSAREATAIVELVHDIGIDLLQFDCVKTFDKTQRLDTRASQSEFDGHIAAAIARAHELGVFVKSMYFENEEPVEHCSRPWNSTFVTRDGYVHPCCLTTQTGDRQAQNRRALGNLVNDSIETIWRGEAFADLRSNMMRGVLPHACHVCPSFTGKPDVAGKQRVEALYPPPVTPVKFVHRSPPAAAVGAVEGNSAS